MARKLKYITELYEEAVQSVTESYESWTAFLRSAARNYKCPFDELLLIYAQRPDATAVLTIEQWNGQFGRWVNRGATGIAVFDGDHNSIKHYFDISDTHPTSHSRRKVPLWEMEEKYAVAVKERLENTFGELRFTEPFSSVLIAAAENASADHVRDYFEEFISVCEDDLPDELSAEELEGIFLKTVKHSIMYMLFTRCGEDTELFISDHFDGLRYFNTPKTVNALGATVGDIAKTVLKEIAAVVLAEMREEQSHTFAKKKEPRYDETKERIQGGTDHEHNILNAGRLSAPGSADAGTARSELGQIREDAGTVLKAAPTHPLHESPHDGETDRASGRDRTDREREDRADDRTDGEDRGTDRADESGRSHEVDGTHEQPETRGGGSDPDGTHIQLTEEAESNTLPAFLVQENIWAVLKYDRYMKRKRQDIALYFTSHDLDADRRKFVKDSYNMDTYCELLANDTRLGYIAREEGFTMWEGNYLTRTSEDTYSWDLVQLFIADMIKSGEYLDGIVPVMQEKTKDVERSTKKTQNATLSDIPSAPLSISQQIIDEVLADGGIKDNSTLRICSFFRQDRGAEENAEFLKDEYGRDGKGFIIDGQRIAMWFDDSGIRIAAGNTAIDTNDAVHLSWEQAARRIRELLDMGRYLPQKDLDRADSYELKMIAEKLWYLDRDCRDGYSILEKQSRRGFPEETAYLAGQLTNRAQVEKLRDRMKQFIIDYAEDENLLRFRYHRPFELYEWLEGMLGERLAFTSDVESRLAPQLVITQDVIDKALAGGSNVSGSKMRIYSYFLKNSSAKDRESFLRKEYGIGGSSYFYYHKESSGKGFSISIGSIVQPYDKVLLKWPAVVKRIDELITAGRYMNRKELEYIPEYEKQELAKQIMFFYRDKKDAVKPYQDEEYSRITDSLASQLNDPERVKKILEMMRTVLDSMTAEEDSYEYDKKTYDDLIAFSKGRFSLFGKKEHIPAAIEDMQEDAEYHLKLGATVHLGIREYEINSFDDKQVTLCDPATPLLLDVMDRNIFDARLRDNSKNDYLRVADKEKMLLQSQENQKRNKFKKRAEGFER